MGFITFRILETRAGWVRSVRRELRCHRMSFCHAHDRVCSRTAVLISHTMLRQLYLTTLTSIHLRSPVRAFPSPIRLYG
jgi:hypothetical protein